MTSHPHDSQTTVPAPIPSADAGPKKLTVAVIGAGFGRFHIKGFLGEPERFHLKAVCDQNPQVREEARKNCGLPASCELRADYQEVLNDPAIDAVVVSLPHHLHEAVGVQAARNKKHILIDKPIARTLEEADRIIQAARENRVTLMVVHNLRYRAAYIKIHELVSSGAIGQPLFAVTRHNQNFNPPAGAAWRSMSAVGGGCVIGSGVHNIDLMRWFFGEPVEVFAYGVHDAQRLEAEAAASVSFRFASGLVVNFACNWAMHGALKGFQWGEWAVFGTRGDIALHEDALVMGRDFGKSIERITFTSGKYESLWSHFANCIASGAEPLTSGPDGRASLALVLKVYESMKLGRPVSC